MGVTTSSWKLSIGKPSDAGRKPLAVELFIIEKYSRPADIPFSLDLSPPCVCAEPPSRVHSLGLFQVVPAVAACFNLQGT